MYNSENNNIDINLEKAYCIVKRLRNKSFYKIKNINNNKSLVKDYLNNFSSFQNIKNGYKNNKHPIWFIKVYNINNNISDIDLRKKILNLLNTNIYENYYLLFNNN